MSLWGHPCLIIHIYETLKLYSAAFHFGHNEIVTVKVFPNSHLEELLHVVYISQTKPSYYCIARYNFNLMPKTNYSLIEKRDDINVDVT
jgi:hypothetical protein